MRGNSTVQPQKRHASTVMTHTVVNSGCCSARTQFRSPRGKRSEAERPVPFTSPQFLKDENLTVQKRAESVRCNGKRIDAISIGAKQRPSHQMGALVIGRHLGARGFDQRNWDSRPSYSQGRG